MKIIILGFLLVLIGSLVILAGIFSMAYQTWKSGNGSEEKKPEAQGAGIVMIGPLPIIFGSNVGALKVVIILAIALMIIAAILFFLPLRML